MTSGFRWLLLSATPLLLVSCAAPYGGYADYAYPAYYYADEYYAPAYGGFIVGGGHRQFDRRGHHFDPHLGASRGVMNMHAGHGGHHH